MDDDTVDLIRKLCTQAGIIMEDASSEALRITATDYYAINATLEVLIEAAGAISAVVGAARAVYRLQRNGS